MMFVSGAIVVHGDSGAVRDASLILSSCDIIGLAGEVAVLEFRISTAFDDTKCARRSKVRDNSHGGQRERLLLPSAVFSNAKM